MRWVEIAGQVGAGKSTTLPHLASALVARGFQAVPLQEAVARTGPQPQQPSGTIGRPQPASTILARSVDAGRQPLLASLFAMANPTLAWQVGRAVRELPIPGPHRRRILRLILRLGAADRAVRGRFDGTVMVLVDEGWAHRAVNLFAWCPTVPQARLDAYLAAIPEPDLLVIVDAPASVVRERLAVRGLPRRLRRSSKVEVERFLIRSQAITERAASRLSDRGIPIVRVVNAGSFEDVARQLAATGSLGNTDASRLQPQAAR